MFNLLTFLTIPWVCLSAYGQAVTPEELVEQRTLLRNVAFCQCLYQAYADLDSFPLRDGSNSAYIKAGRYHPSAYDSTNALAKLYAERRYDDQGLEFGDFEGGTLRMDKCFYFYESAALDSLVRRLDKEITLEDRPSEQIPGEKESEDHLPPDSAKIAETVIQQERLGLKKIAFCGCLRNVYKEYDSAWDRDHTGGAYLEAGDYDLYVYAPIGIYARAYAERTHAADGTPYSGPHGERLGIMKCLDFYKSAVLDSFVVEQDDELDYESAFKKYLRSVEREKAGLKPDTVKPPR